MRCVVMQPTYLPWAGYFNLISQADVFVFLDDVQYEKSSWQNRNRILLHGKDHWITAPALKESLSQHINTIRTENKYDWRKKNYKLLQSAYGKHPHGKDILDILEKILDESIIYLADLNIRLILDFCEKLSLRTEFYRSSELNIGGARSERLLKMCQFLGCDEYLSPVGSTQYLAEDGAFNNAPVKLIFQKYVPEIYMQKGSDEFIGSLSIVDVVANLGWDKTMEYVRYGRRNSD
jgi:hypothetical protein